MEYKANRPLTSDNARLHFNVFLSAAPPLQKKHTSKQCYLKRVFEPVSNLKKMNTLRNNMDTL